MFFIFLLFLSLTFVILLFLLNYFTDQNRKKIHFGTKVAKTAERFEQGT